MRKDKEESTDSLKPWQSQDDKQEVQAQGEGVSPMHSSGADNRIL